MKYQIIINENQRLALVEALMRLGHGIDEEDADLEPMLRALPQDEAEDPGCFHDFTL